MESLHMEELTMINGGLNAEGLLAGALLITTGVGALAIAVTPGLNVAVAATVAYAGSWGLAGGAMSTIYGLVA